MLTESDIGAESDSGSDFNPYSTYEDSNAETTPSQRAVLGMNTPAAAKRRVDLATSDLTASRCLIENTSEANEVEYAHCLRRATKGGLLDSLEFAWGMDRFTLNVDTRLNIFRLSSKFHRAFDSNKWLLLPDISIIESYWNGREDRVVPDINGPTFRYTLVAHPNMFGVPIHRQSFPPPAPPASAPAGDFTYYAHPYYDFPTIFSHVHPRFIICNTGAKLDAGQANWVAFWGHIPNCTQVVGMIQDIWKAWKAVVPKGTPFLRPKSYNNDDDNMTDNSKKTVPRRLLPKAPKRKTYEGQDSPTPTSSKHPRAAADSAWLDDETLREFDQQDSSRSDRKGSKNYLVLDWLSGVLDSECGEEVEENAIDDENLIICN